ncbi:MAG: DDE-type integrase/transposase/recombinase [Nitrosarchaeum sp.]|nr:DDE-type integrase/transposase/recombinase [Nitrosarchaeum sp.]
MESVQITRDQKGLEISLIAQNIRRENSRVYKVRSQSSPKTYSVTRDGLTWECSCPDHKFRHVICKHIFSVQFSTQYRKQVKISSPIFYQEQETKQCCPKCRSPKFKKEIGTKKFPKIEHLKVSPIKEGMQNMPIERWRGTLKQRLKVMRGMNDSNSAQYMADGFALYYNFIRKHSVIGKTPAEEADIDLSLSGNRWENLIKKARRG